MCRAARFSEEEAEAEVGIEIERAVTDSRCSFAAEDVLSELDARAGTFSQKLSPRLGHDAGAARPVCRADQTDTPPGECSKIRDWDDTNWPRQWET